jgi:Tfp pilus assembly protein PilX
MPTRPARLHRRSGLADQRGSVAVAMMVILVVSILVLALLATAEFGLRSSRRAGDSANALQLADAGINDATKAITAHTTSFTGGNSIGTAGSYTYSATKDGTVWRLDSTGTDATGVRRRVLADATDQPTFGNAFFGLSSVTIKGTADSYTGPSNPCSSSPAFGVVGSNGTITFTGGIGTKNCRGSSGWNYPADGCSFDGQTTIPPGAIGAGACPPAPDTFTTSQKFNPPPVVVPAGLTSEGAFTCPVNGTIPAGTHLYTSATFNGGCTVGATGNAVLYVTGPVSLGVDNGACKSVINPPTGACSTTFPPTWYQSGWTSRLQINVAGNGVVSFANHAVFFGVINAPNSVVSANGGGTPQVDVFGSVLANSIVGAAQFAFHYDQALRQQFNTGQYQVSNWREEPVP